MRKIFESIGLIILMFFSFFVTEKTSMIAKNVDEIMISIKDNYKDYETLKENAKIFDNKIIPGLCAKKVDIEKSYKEMKKIGLYNPKLFVFYHEKPEINLSNNFDKLIISDNSNLNTVYFFVDLNENNKENLKKIKFNNYNFIINAEFYKNNLELINDLKSENNSFIISSTLYKNYKFVSNNYIKNYKKNIFCVNDSKNEFLDICSSNKSSTITLSTIIYKEYLLNMKKNVHRGAFIKILLNENYIEEKDMVEKYIDSKGLKLSSIDNDLNEC